MVPQPNLSYSLCLQTATPTVRTASTPVPPAIQALPCSHSDLSKIQIWCHSPAPPYGLPMAFNCSWDKDSNPEPSLQAHTYEFWLTDSPASLHSVQRLISAVKSQWPPSCSLNQTCALPPHGLCWHYPSPHSLHLFTPQMSGQTPLLHGLLPLPTDSLGQDPSPVLLQDTSPFVIIPPLYDYLLCVCVLS